MTPAQKQHFNTREELITIIEDYCGYLETLVNLSTEDLDLLAIALQKIETE